MGQLDLYRDWLTTSMGSRVHGRLHRGQRVVPGTVAGCGSTRCHFISPAVPECPAIELADGASGERHPAHVHEGGNAGTDGWTLLRGKSGISLRDWARDLTESTLPEFTRFAVGLNRDFDAVLAGVTATRQQTDRGPGEPPQDLGMGNVWSRGPESVAGQIALPVPPLMLHHQMGGSVKKGSLHGILP